MKQHGRRPTRAEDAEIIRNQYAFGLARHDAIQKGMKVGKAKGAPPRISSDPIKNALTRRSAAYKKEFEALSAANRTSKEKIAPMRVKKK